MGSVLQFAAFLAICWLFRGAVTHANQSDDKVLNNKHSNRNAGSEDFYFDEQKANDDNLKTGRAIPQTAWSKEDKEETQNVENKTGGQFNNEFSFKNALSYLLNMVQELKKDILGIKEMTSLKNTKDSTNSRDNSKDNLKPNKRGENSDTPKADTSKENKEFAKENQKPKTNYIADYFQKNGITFDDDELEISSDESDDSSHKLNEGDSMHKVNNNDDRCIFECSERERKHGRYSSGAEETTVIPISHTKIPEESDKEFDGTRDDEREDNLKESTRKPSKMNQSNSKTSREETENTPSSKMGICVKKNDDTYNNLNEKNENPEKPLRSAEYVTTRSPQNKNFNKANSERPNQYKSKDNLSKMIRTSPDSRNSGKKSKNEGGLDFDSKSGILGQATTLSSQSTKDVIYPENIENEQDASEMSFKIPLYNKQQEQITSLKPDDQEQARNNAKSIKNNKPNEYSTVSLQPHEVGSEIPNHEMSTDTEIKGNPKESRDKRLDVNSSQTTVPYSENEPNSKTVGQQSSNIFGTDTTISPANSGNMNKENLNKNPSENMNGKKGPNGNGKPAANQQGKDYSETQRNTETKQPQQLNDDSEPEKTSKNNKLNDSNSESNNKEKDDDLATMATNDHPPPQDSNSEIQNHDDEESDKPQEEQKNNENLNKRDRMLETSPDQEYDFEEDNEDFDISDELTDTEMDEDVNQNEEGELITNDGNEMNDDEINADNIATVSRNESQISRHTGYIMEEKSQEQYNTFLEYFYKNSNSSLFQALKNQSNDFSQTQ